MEKNYISIVVPVKNEQNSLAELFKKCSTALNHLGNPFEIIFVDDGSTDLSWQHICDLQLNYPDLVRAIRLRRNFGKSAALSAGFQQARGSVIITMDGDLQDDPDDIGKFIDKLREGYDCVSGWKISRQDPREKKIASYIFNKITAWVSGIPLHDFNCGFKAYHVEVVKHLEVYGDLHRYIPVIAHNMGYRVGEVPVKHHARQHGVSKYGWERFARGFMDLITVMATTRYLKNPGHLFGGVGLVFGFAGGIILAYLAVLWLLNQGPIGNRPLFFVGIMTSIMSIQFFSLGVLAELVIKTSPVSARGQYLVAERRVNDSRPGDAT